MSCDPNYVDAIWSYYRYKPSMAAPVFFVILFIFTTTLHIFQMAKTKTWYLIPFCIGGLCEIIGYIGRAMNANEDPGCWTLGPYVTQTLLLLIAPALMAASIYMILGRIILLTDGEVHALIKRRWLTKIFVLGDVLSLFLQAAGGSLLGGADDDSSLMDTGNHVIIGGLFVQLFFFGMFIVVAGLFHRRMLLDPTPTSRNALIRWRKYLLTLYTVSVLIWIRSVFRVIEYLQGNAGSIMRHEAYVFIFDATLMFLVMAWMNWFHPSEIGLLLRHEETISNGFELLPLARWYQKAAKKWNPVA